MTSKEIEAKHSTLDEYNVIEVPLTDGEILVLASASVAACASVAVYEDIKHD
jgi:hypothetical protein